MSILKKHFGAVLKGKIVFDHPEEFRETVGQMEEQRVAVTVQKESQKRSKDQNSYYWAVVVHLIAEHTGHTPEEVHEAMKMMFLKVPGTGGLPETVKSSTVLTTKEFGEFVESVKRWAATSLEVYCPDANDVEW